MFLFLLLLSQAAFPATVSMECFDRSVVLVAPTPDPLGQQVLKLVSKRGDLLAEKELDSLLDGLIRRVIKTIRVPKALNPNDPATFDDLVQESKIRILTKLDKYDPNRRFMAWLSTVANNRIRDLGRGENSRSRKKKDPTTLVIDEEEDFFSLVMGSQDPPDKILIKREIRTDVLRALETLPEIFKEPLRLICLERLKFREAAERLGIPAGTVKSRYSEGRKRLLEIFPDIAELIQEMH